MSTERQLKSREDSYADVMISAGGRAAPPTREVGKGAGSVRLDSRKNSLLKVMTRAPDT